MAPSIENILNPVQYRQLTAMQATARSLDVASVRLSTGKKVNSALDAPGNFFIARALDYRAADLLRAIDRIGQNLQVIRTAEIGIEAAQRVLDQAEAFVTDVEQKLLAGQIDLSETVDDTPPDNVTNITFTNIAELLTYSPGQDGAGVVTLIDDTGFELDGNLWKRRLINYEITADTVLEFDFRSTNIPEIAGIGFDNDNNFANNANHFFLYGQQNTGVPYAAPTPTFQYDGSGDWVHVEIPVGTFFTGNFSHMIFINDDDGPGDDGEAEYNNIFLREGPIPDPETVTTAPQELEREYGLILDQLDLIGLDSNYRGTNLLNNNTMTTYFNERRSSFIQTEGIMVSSAGLGLEEEGFASVEVVRDKLEQIRDAREELRAYTTSLTVDLGVITTRENFVAAMVNILSEGRDDLTLADQNEEAAKMLALQVRQQIQVSVLSFRVPGILGLF